MNVDYSVTNAREDCMSASSGRLDASTASRTCLHLDQLKNDLQKTYEQIKISSESQSNTVQT